MENKQNLDKNETGKNHYFIVTEAYIDQNETSQFTTFPLPIPRWPPTCFYDLERLTGRVTHSHPSSFAFIPPTQVYLNDTSQLITFPSPRPCRSTSCVTISRGSLGALLILIPAAASPALLCPAPCPRPHNSRLISCGGGPGTFLARHLPFPPPHTPLVC